ncbi:hypothetical protein VNO77_32492 [Canavalia gladiata]|uniref:ACB domain-containing protein n=1 Tax=Canavalia gladiata TaxID=3824 RepID=A0AAN9Q484_CANGL
MEAVTAGDLFATASLALLLTFLVAKLVSLAMIDTHTHTTTKRHVRNEPVGSVHRRERLTVQTAQSKSRVEFISPVQVAATYVETERKIEGATSVKPDSNVAVESLVKSDSDIAVKEEIVESVEETEKFDDSTEQRNMKSVEEISSIEPSTEIEVSAVESSVKENDDEDDDWEGIERSELEKEFMVATEFVGGEENGLGSVLGNNVQLELYGLHKVATEGPCRDPQPMPLKLFARAKWYQFLTFLNYPFSGVVKLCYAFFNCLYFPCFALPCLALPCSLLYLSLLLF